jgi:hypothetical protein
MQRSEERVVAMIIISLLIFVLGCLVTWFLSRHCYAKAAEDFKKEAKELRHLNNLMLRRMEHAGWIRLNKDEQGNILGSEQTVDVQSGIISMEGVGTPTLIQHPGSPKNQ